MRDPVLPFRAPEPMRQALRHQAEAEGVSTSELLRRVVAQFLSQAAPTFVDHPTSTTEKISA
jgi:hypothetical protein